MLGNLTIRQKTLGNLAIMFLVCTGIFVISFYEITRAEEVEKQASANLLEKGQVLYLISNANHEVSRTAFSFKNVLVRGLNPTDREQYMGEFNENRRKFNAIIDQISATKVYQGDATLAADVDAFRSLYNEVADKYAGALSIFDGTDPMIYVDLDRMVRGIDRPVVAKGAAIQNEILEGRDRLVQTTLTKIHAMFVDIELHIAFGLIFLLGISAALSFWFGESIRKILGAEPKDLKVIAEKIAQGNLTQSAKDKKTKAQTGSVLASFDAMRSGLVGLINEILKSSKSLERSMNEVQTQLTSLTESSETQAEASASMAAGVEEMSVSISQVSDAAVQSSGAANASANAAEQGMEVMRATSADFAQTAEGSKRLSARIGSLGEQSRKITRIIQVIEEIAEQTNLLALNAAIEAARAGEQGRGFAVVADEVRQLAERTTQSTTEIESMVSAIQKGTEEAVVEMNQWSSRTEEGLTRVQEAESFMSKIKTEAETVMRMISEVDSALREQSSASQQIANHVEKVSASSEENSMSVGEINKNLTAVNSVLAGLVKQTGQFEVD